MSKPKRRRCGGCSQSLYPRDLIHVDRIGYCAPCADKRVAKLMLADDPTAKRMAAQLSDAIEAWRAT